MKHLIVTIIILALCFTLVFVSKTTTPNLEPIQNAEDYENLTTTNFTEPPHIHKFIEYTQNATCTQDGYTRYMCECGEIQETLVLPAIKHNYTTKTIAATCDEQGYTVYTCKHCNKEYRDDYTNKLAHHYSAWKHDVNATPEKEGTKYRYCTHCKAKQVDSYKFDFAGPCAVYIKSANLNTQFVYDDLTQAAIDAHDVVYTYLDFNDAPFIAGHRNRSLGVLYKTKIGDKVYVNHNGEIAIYVVRISEYSLQNRDHSDIIGQITGTSLWHNFENETLHMFTCYGTNNDGRWMVLAERIN